MGFDDKEYQILLLGALLHDIGKFYQRGLPKTSGKHTNLGQECFENLFRERLSRLLSQDELNSVESAIGNHHNFEKHITLADCLSAGMERISLDNEETGDPAKERLLSIFNNISLSNQKISKKFSYLLTPLAMDKSIFPEQFQEYDLTKEYKSLWDKFIEEIRNIPIKNLRSYLNGLYAVLHKYTWCIPSATYKDEPDISLFDHSKTTAAILGCLYFCEKTGESTGNEFLLVTGDISGIQSFIYKITKFQGIGGISKRLRGRSFYLTLLQEVIAKYLIEYVGLFSVNILFCSGGRFELLLPNTKASRMAVDTVKSDINNWLFNEYGGELGMVIEKIEAGRNRLAQYGDLLQELNDKLSITKKQKFLSLIQDETFWIERTGKGGGIKICNVCGISKITTDEPCDLCKLHKDIGGILPDISHLVYATQNLEDITGLGVPFDRFGTVYLLKKSPQMNSNWSEDKVLDLQMINSLDEVNASFRYLGNTAPVAKRDFIIDGNQEDEDKKVKEGDVLSFEIIADGSKGDKRIGILKMDVDYLGLIFAIGLEEDQHSKRKSISRITALSRLMDMFFSGCLNRICNDVFKKWLADSNWQHKNKVDEIFYIIYSGGDDLLIVGPWSEMPYLAKAIHEEFKEFTCNNPDLDISAGIFVCKPKYPISLAGKAAGGELNASKENGRKRITFFGETVEWRIEENLNFSDLMDFGEFLTKRILDDSPNDKIPRSFVHGLLRKHTQYDMGKNPNFIPAIIYQLARNIRNDEVKNELKTKLITDKRGFFKNVKIPASYALLKTRKEG